MDDLTAFLARMFGESISTKGRFASFSEQYANEFLDLIPNLKKIVSLSEIDIDTLPVYFQEAFRDLMVWATTVSSPKVLP